jgi:Protein of unknown function (DUF3047)
MKLLVISLILLLTCITSSNAREAELHIGKFSTGDLAGWKEQTVWNAKKTTYSLIPQNGKSVLVGKSSNSASGLIYKTTIDPKLYPIIKWSWKIDHTVNKSYERNRDGHDFAARLYVVFSRGFFSATRAIEYVWGNVMHKGEILRSPYSDNAVMIAVDAGEEQAGQWVSHKRNYYDDYRAAFREEPPKTGAIAIMTDSDNTHESSLGYYGDISLFAAVKENEPKPKEIKSKEAAPKEPPHKDLPQKEELHKESPNGALKNAPAAPLVSTQPNP